ncbi:MAG: acetoacetate decarboxylase family protein [Actinobacteria bacterium]|nr:acetoacetate decarboxylase family protein [Actinomycetota bacterium]
MVRPTCRHGPFGSFRCTHAVQCRPVSTTSEASGAATPTVHWGEIDGLSIDFPMEVEELRSATLTFTVPIDAARALLPGDAFEVTEIAPGSAMLVVALCDYVRNPWGDYDEVNLGLLVNPVGRPEAVGAFQWRMPVDQQLTCAAGNRVLGLPKTVEDLHISYSGEPGEGTVVVRLVMSDEPAGSVTMLVELPRPVAAGDASAGLDSAITYSYLEGRPMELPLEMRLPSSPVDAAEVRIVLGEGALAQELRSLGLPRAPDMALWGEGLRAVFQMPNPLDPASR